MGFVRIVGILIVIGGAVLFGLSHYIAGQVAEGRQEIRSAQQKVDTGKKVLSLDPVAEKVGGVFTGAAQKKIDAGAREANEYEALAGNLRIGGIVLLVAGAVVVLLGKRRKSA